MQEDYDFGEAYSEYNDWYRARGRRRILSNRLTKKTTHVLQAISSNKRSKTRQVTLPSPDHPSIKKLLED